MLYDRNMTDEINPKDGDSSEHKESSIEISFWGLLILISLYFFPAQPHIKKVNTNKIMNCPILTFIKKKFSIFFK